MMSHHSRSMVGMASLFVVAGTLLTPRSAGAQEREGPNVDVIPKAVMDALKAKFPQARIQVWTMEQEGGLVLYDIEFTQQGRKFEADVIADGTIHNWEREIVAEDLPEAVTATVEHRYAGSTMKEIMAITAVDEGDEALEGYEIVLDTADGTEVEITVAPDGAVLEDSSDRGDPTHRLALTPAESTEPAYSDVWLAVEGDGATLAVAMPDGTTFVVECVLTAEGEIKFQWSRIGGGRIANIQFIGSGSIDEGFEGTFSAMVDGEPRPDMSGVFAMVPLSSQ